MKFRYYFHFGRLWIIIFFYPNRDTGVIYSIRLKKVEMKSPVSTIKVERGLHIFPSFVLDREKCEQNVCMHKYNNTCLALGKIPCRFDLNSTWKV